MQAIWIRIQMFLSYTEDRQIGLVGMATKPGPFYVASNVPWRLNPTQHPFLFCRFSQGQFCKFLKLSIRPPPYINITKTDHTIPHPQALKKFSNLSLSLTTIVNPWLLHAHLQSSSRSLFYSYSWRWASSLREQEQRQWWFQRQKLQRGSMSMLGKTSQHLPPVIEHTAGPYTADIC